MGMFILEALIALGLLLFIVWWTLGPVHRREQEGNAVDVEPLGGTDASMGTSANPSSGTSGSRQTQA